MQKKIIVLFCLLIFTFNIGGCSNKSHTHATELITTSTESETVKNDKSHNSWGIADELVATNFQNLSQDFCINFPSVIGQHLLNGSCAIQDDSSLVLISCQFGEEAPSASSLDEVIPAYLENINSILDEFYGLSKDFKLSVDSEIQCVEVNGRDTVKFTGKCDIRSIMCDWVGFSTQLETNGAYVCCIVVDTTKDQSLGELIENNAINIAGSIYELN